MAKKPKQPIKNATSSAFVQHLKQHAPLTPYIELVKKFAISVNKKLTTDDCLTDLNANLDLIRTRAFLGLQLERLAESQIAYTDIAKSFQQVEHILNEDIVVSAHSRQLLDPHCKSERDYSSAINHYKKWLLQLLFLLTMFESTEKFKYSNAVLEEFLLFIHDVFCGETISKVTLRQAAKIDATTVTELLRGTAIQVHSHFTNAHWSYVTVTSLQQSGYVPSAYIKIYQT